MIGWALPQQAGCAIQVFAHNAVVGGKRRGGDVVRRAKNGYDGNMERSCDVHGTGVVGYEEAAMGKKGEQLPQRCLANKV